MFKHFFPPYVNRIELNTSLFQIRFDTNETLVKNLVDTTVVMFEQVFWFVFIAVIWNNKKNKNVR